MSATEDGVLNKIDADKTPQQCDYDDAVAYAHDIIGDLNSGMQRWIDWNMVVDRMGGPRRVPGGFAAPLVLEDDGSLTETASYAFLKAIARAFRPGAVRIGKSVYGREVEAAACRNADGTIGVVLLNRAGEDISVNLRMSGKIVQDVKLPAGTLTTVEIGENEE